MRKKLLSPIVKRLLRRNESGQAIVILAIGFVALLAFVGLTTDISILFVRYSTLRRAVDSAAIAAAGEMRQDANYANVAMAARQFIEFHDLNPRRVLVETCNSVQNIDTDPDTPDVQADPTICTPDQRKVVRVTAEIDSPTVFLRLLGFGSIELRASATSETAVLDVVLVMDVSESMLNQTTVQDYAEVNQAVAYVPPVAWNQNNVIDPNSVYGRELADTTGDGEATTPDYDPADPYFSFFEYFWQRDLLGVPQALVNDRYTYRPIGPTGTGDIPTNGAAANAAYDVRYFVPQGITETQYHPRAECRVRFFPWSQQLPTSQYIRGLYGNPAYGVGSFPLNWSDFVPTYDFYGCCNDPGNGQMNDLTGDIIPGDSTAPDRNFSDLVCQPFKSARDATRQFLDRIDFVRGDRVAFVTFDRTAFIIDPDGNTPNGSTPMIEEESLAINTLDGMIGVHAEPNYYMWDDANGGWTGFAQGLDVNGNSIPINYEARTAAEDPRGQNPATYTDYPAKDACPFQNAALPYPFSLYASRNAPGNYPNGRSQEGSEGLYNIMTPDIVNDVNWALISGAYGLDVQSSYELWASCRNGNIGAALREANNALTNPQTRRVEGAIYIIILLSDGAAGGSDPARQYGIMPTTANPYIKTQDDNPVTPAIEPTRWGLRGQYGAFGVCPYGRFDQPAELVATEGETIFPFCLDEQPETRHFCYASSGPPLADQGSSPVGADTGFTETGFGPGARDRRYDTFESLQWNVDRGYVYDVDVGVFPDVVGLCDIYYDVDDYVHDWADYVGRVRSGGGDNIPTIFTIGFGIDFALGNGSCAANIPDCLGEEALRYIADVGDNFRIDTDYQQDWMDNGQLDDSLVATGGDYGAPGICEPQVPGGGFNRTDLTVTFLTPKESCGNYFNAPSQEELELVFDEIASRMFTRLAG